MLCAMFLSLHRKYFKLLQMEKICPYSSCVPWCSFNQVPTHQHLNSPGKPTGARVRAAPSGSKEEMKREVWEKELVSNWGNTCKWFFSVCLADGQGTVCAIHLQQGFTQLNALNVLAIELAIHKKRCLTALAGPSKPRKRGIEGCPWLAKGFCFLGGLHPAAQLEQGAGSLQSRAGLAGLLSGCKWACKTHSCYRGVGKLQTWFLSFLSKCKVLLNITSVFCMVWFLFLSQWDEKPAQVVGHEYPRNFCQAHEGVNKQPQQTETLRFLTPPRDISAMWGCTSLHLQLPGACLARLWEKAREQPSSKGAASSPITHLLLVLDRNVLCSFYVLNQIQLDFQGSAVPKPLTHCQQCRECWFMSLGEQAGITTSCMISICFVPNYSHLILPFYNTRKKKKSDQLAQNPYFLPGQGIGEDYLCKHLKGYREVFSCGWVLGPNTSSGKIQSFLQTIIF